MLVQGAHGAFSGLTTKSTVNARRRQIIPRSRETRDVRFRIQGTLFARVFFVRGTRTGQRRGSYIHVVIAGIRTPAATEHAPERRML